MARRKQQQNGEVYVQQGFWRLRSDQDSKDAKACVEWHRYKPIWIGPATGPERLTRKQAIRIACENFVSLPDQNGLALHSEMTIARFVENVFVPEHVSTKKLSGRTHYRAILKHIIAPEEVDRIFHVDAQKSKPKLKAAPNWPYLGDRRLCDAQPEDVRHVIVAAVARGYSSQTITHIRNVIHCIFAQAQKRWFLKENPANLVHVPGIIHKEAHTLTLAEAKQVLRSMKYPEYELALIAMLTGLNVAEICGLQWKRVNLSETWSFMDDEPIPPRTIAVRMQWYRGELGSVNRRGRDRSLAIPDALFPVLQELSHRATFTKPDDFVLVARTGRPINARNIAADRLKPIGQALGMPWLSWQVFRRTHRTLPLHVGLQLEGCREP